MDKLLEYCSSDEDSDNKLEVRGSDFFSLNSYLKPACLNVTEAFDENKNIKNNKISKKSKKEDLISTVKEWTFGANYNPPYTFSNPVNVSNFDPSTNYFLENANYTNYNNKINSELENSTFNNKYISKRKLASSSDEENINYKIQSRESKLILEQEYSFMSQNPHKYPKHKLPRKLMHSFKSHEKAVGRLKWCSAQYEHLLLSTSFDCTIKVHDIFSGKTRLTLQHHKGAIRDASWSDDALTISSCGYDKHAIITDTTTGKVVMQHKHTNHLTCLQHHPRHPNLFVVGSIDCLLKMDSRLPDNPVSSFRFKDKMSQVLDICFTSDTCLASSCDLVGREASDRTLVVWDFNSTAPISNQIFHEKYTCPRLIRHPFKDEFLAQTQGNYIAQFSCLPPYKLNKKKQFNKHQVNGYDVGCHINPSGNVVVSGSADGRVVFYQYNTTKLLTTIDTHHFNRDAKIVETKNEDECEWSVNNADNNKLNFISENYYQQNKINEDDESDVILDVAWHPSLNASVAFSTQAGVVGVLN